MQVMFLKPIYKDYVWGGFNISKNIKKGKTEKIAESLEVISNKDMQSIITNGEYEGKNLGELFKDTKIKKEIFGNFCMNFSEFPLIIKYIDAKENLSVQVHPNDKYAKELENANGKTELWYILDCKKGAKLICGTKEGVSKDQLDNLKLDDIDEFFNFIEVEKGDIIYVEPGTVHSILSDIMLYEIQQNSDITYRVYDWDRNLPNRPLHIDKSKKVINLNNKVDVMKAKSKTNSINEVFHNEKFYLDKIIVDGIVKNNTNNNSFQILNIVSGQGTISYGDYIEPINSGDCILLPACLGDYTLEGNIEILMSYLGENSN